MAQRSAVNKKFTIVVQSSWNLVKIFISWVLYFVGISAWLDQNCGFFINSHVFDQSDFHLFTLYIKSLLGLRPFSKNPKTPCSSLTLNMTDWPTFGSIPVFLRPIAPWLLSKGLNDRKEVFCSLAYNSKQVAWKVPPAPVFFAAFAENRRVWSS